MWSVIWICIIESGKKKLLVIDFFVCLYFFFFLNELLDRCCKLSYNEVNNNGQLDIRSFHFKLLQRVWARLFDLENF